MGESRENHIVVYLDKMVDHEGSNARPPPLRVNKHKGDVCLIVATVGDQKCKGNYYFPGGYSGKVCYKIRRDNNISMALDTDDE